MNFSKPMRKYAIDAAFEPAEIENMFEMFRCWNIADGTTWSCDWEEVWFNWVDREVTMENDRYDRARRRAYFERHVA